MRFPSGDQTGVKYSPCACVSRFSPVPSSVTMKMPGVPNRRLAKAIVPGPLRAPPGPVVTVAPAPEPPATPPPPPPPPAPDGSLVAEPASPPGPPVTSAPAAAVVDVLPPATSFDPSPSPPPPARARPTTTRTAVAATMSTARRRHQAGSALAGPGGSGAVDTPKARYNVAATSRTSSGLGDTAEAVVYV